MTFSQFLKELEDIEDDFEKDENEIDFTMLKMLQSVLKQKEQKDKELQLLEQEVDEMVNSIVDRPADYFETKERLIEKMIEKSRARNAIPKDPKDREAISNEATLNTITKLFDKMISQTTSQEVKFQLDDVKKSLKNINVRAQRTAIKKEIKNARIKARLILQKEIEKEQSNEISQ